MHPDFLCWSFNGIPDVSPVEARSSLFKFSFVPAVNRGDFSFRNEVLRGIERIEVIRNGKPVALAFSGGIKCELMARALSVRGMPYELFFLDVWGLNRATLEEEARPLAEKLGKKLNIVRLEKMEYFKYSKGVFLEFGIESPDPVSLTYLFSRIPEDFFILNGAGSLERSGEIYRHIAGENPRSGDKGSMELPYSVASIFYYLWAAKRNREGEFYFFQSTPGLIASSILDPEFVYDYPFASDRKVIYSAFPEIAQRDKSGNWSSPQGKNQNFELRAALSRLAVLTPQFQFWRKLVGTNVRLDDIFLFDG